MTEMEPHDSMVPIPISMGDVPFLSSPHLSVRSGYFFLSSCFSDSVRILNAYLYTVKSGLV